MSINNLSTQEFYERLKLVIRPSAPISSFEMLFGREKQINEIEGALYADGRHAFIYGDRGVGKTSLAQTIAVKLQQENDPIFVGCEPKSSLSTIVQDILSKGIKSIDLAKETTLGAGVSYSGIGLSAQYKKSEKATPQVTQSVSSAASALASLIGKHSSTPFIVIDEFDQIEDIEERKNFGRLIKNLGDQDVNIKIIFTGIGDSLHSLIGGHLSSERQIHQTHLDALPWSGRDEIIDRAFNEFDIFLDKDVKFKISGLSDGYPHYVHLLCEKILCCVYSKDEEIDHITHPIFLEGLTDAVSSVSETLKYDYVQATNCRPEYFHHILWAMADSGDLQREKKTILLSYNHICNQKEYQKLDNKQFDRQFTKLKQEDFGSVIIPALEGRKGWFRFKENMLRGYVRMMAEINGVKLDFERRFTANEPSAQVASYRSTSYQPLTPIENKIFRKQKNDTRSE
ncbi:AAA family ATPase [Erwinia pyrifoliae]|uniref:ATP-binding protein n=1 Tax=Erwinia pyrifoliae TaxID=79967 RepID=A0ABY5X3T3_ERWPY|nr:ATP-binding protein [Erwinia pyrifoliae]MCT2388751.1 ATP-binding protein [Erwinia pyrifoliae]MCU8586920.1 ATP-binding protein [Erwinia pyrifoliae]UWS30791.1 ATP-binding protein [Erwinia pyrifoliae]UWS31983.1 ATP-binding protein [Erwinia pyrifoliae]